MVAIGKQSVGSTANLFQGYWSHVEFVHDPLGTPNAIYLGVVQEGNLEISREDTEYMGTNFPRRVELLTPSQVGMKFSGQIDELHKTNLHIAMGDLASDTNNYIYPGAACSFEDQFGNLICRRKRCDGFVMEALLWKTLGSGALAIGGDAAVAAVRHSAAAAASTHSAAAPRSASTLALAPAPVLAGRLGGGLGRRRLSQRG